MAWRRDRPSKLARALKHNLWAFGDQIDDALAQLMFEFGIAQVLAIDIRCSRCR